MRMKKEKKDLVYLLFISIISFFSSLWAEKADLMEARNFVTAREMVRYGNWIIPTMNGNFRFEKPPLPTWITAIFMKIFETTSNEFILRIPIALLSIGMIFLIYYLVKIGTNNHRLGYITGLVTSTTFMLIKLGNKNTWDMFGYILVFGFVTFIFKGLKTNRYKDFLIGGIFLGGSLLSKGPVPLYGMGISFFVAYIYVYGFKNIKENWDKIILAFILGSLLAGAWPLAMIVYQKNIFMSVMNKEVSTWTTKHTKWIFYYLDYYIYTGVWIFFVLGSFHKKWVKTKIENKEFFSFLFFWNFSSLILLSLIKIKKDRYAIPMYILSPMMAAHLIDYYLKKNWVEIIKKERIFLKFNFVVLTILSLGTPFLLYIKGYSKGYIGIFYFISITTGFLCLGHIFIKVILEKESLKKGLYITGVLMLFINISTTWFVEKIVMDGVRDGYLPLSSLKDQEVIKMPILTIDSDEVTNVWNIGKKIEKIKEISQLPNEFLLLEEADEKKVEKAIGTEYQLKSNKTYYKYQDEEKLIHLYRIEKIKK